MVKEKYKVFTSKYDEIKNAEELENEEEISRLKVELDMLMMVVHFNDHSPWQVGFADLVARPCGRRASRGRWVQ